MQKLKCELCGGIDFTRTEGGLYQCQHCGCNYTLEQARSILNVTAEVTKGNAEFQRLLKNGEIFRKQKKFSEAYQVYADASGEFPGEPESYFQWITSVFECMEYTRSVQCRCSYRSNGLVASQTIDALYRYALQQCAGKEIRNRYESYWENSWKAVADGLEQGRYGIERNERGYTDPRLFAETKEILLRCGPVAERIVRKGQVNAALLLKNGVRYGLTDRSSKTGWLPYKPVSKNPHLGVSFVLGNQIEWRDYVPYYDNDYGIASLPSVVKLDSSSIRQYQKEAAENRKALIKSGVCPYCGTALQSGFFGKRCGFCGM